MTGTKHGSVFMQIVTAVLANIPSLTYGIQIGWLSPMAPVLQSLDTPAQAPLTDNEISWMAASLTLAAVPSVLLFSYSSDRFGRKISIIMLSVLSAISWTLKLWTVNPTGLIFARAFAGISAAGCFLVVPVYVREISQDTLRGALGSLVMSLCNVGVIIVYVLGMSLSYFWNQWVYLAICFTHIAVFLFMPESPAFLIKRGNEKGAIKAISWFRGLSANDPTVLDEVRLLKTEEEAHKDMPTITFVSIIKDRSVFRAFRVCLVLIGVQTLSGCFAIVNYASSIFQRSGAQWSANALALLVGALQLAGSLVATSTVERFGRRVLLVSSCAIISLCMASVATVFLLDHLQIDFLPRWIPVISVCLCIFAYGAGLAPVPFIVMAEVFSFQLRARLAGAVMMFSWTNSTLTVLLFAPVANMFGEHVVFFAFAAVTLFGAIYTSLFVPETKGRSLEEIYLKFAGK